MGNSSETKVTRRDAILTTGKAAVAFGAAALLAGRLPKIQPPVTTHNEVDGMDLEIPAGGLATVAVTYFGNDDDEPDPLGPFDPMELAEAAPGINDTSNPINLGLVPIQFVISEVDTTGATPSGLPARFDTVSVMTVGSKTGDKGRHFFVHVWYDQQGSQGIILPPSPSRPIVVGQSVDVEALEDAVRASFPSKGAFTINDASGSGHTYLILAWGSLSPNAP